MYITWRFPLLIVLLLVGGRMESAQGQLLPNPNPPGNIIDISGNVAQSEPYNNHGTINIVLPDGHLVNGAQFANEGAINVHGVIETERLWNFQGATFDTYGLVTITGSLFNLSYGNSGKPGMLVDTNGVVQNNDDFVNDGWLENNGLINTSNGGFTNVGTLSGSGRVVGTIFDMGTHAPGSSAGVSTVDGHWNKMAGSTEIELGGTFDGGGANSLTEFDWIDVTGNVDLAGSLSVDLIDGFVLNELQQFRIIQVGGQLNGQFDGLNEGGLVGNFGRPLFITYVGGDGNDVVLYSVPEPTSAVLILSSLLLVHRILRCVGSAHRSA